MNAFKDKQVFMFQPGKLQSQNIDGSSNRDTPLKIVED